MLSDDELCRDINRFHEDPLEVLRCCGGYYECPKYESGKRLGPLVSYTACDEKGRQYVGDVYVNFAKVEENPVLVEFCAHEITCLMEEVIPLDDVDVFCGAPLGGLALAYNLASLDRKRFTYPEKKVIAPATPQERESSVIVFSRHEVMAGERVVIVDDVVNNFTTTEELIELIRKAGASVVAIVSFFDRSRQRTSTFPSCKQEGAPIPVVSIIKNAVPQYRQDDPGVSDDIANGNVVWSPKHEWQRLLDAMNATR